MSNNTNESKILVITNYITLIASLFILASISLEIILDKGYYTSQIVQKSQIYVCLAFLFDYFFRLHYSKEKMIFFFKNIIILLVSIPYLSICYFLNLTIEKHIGILLMAMPLVRGAYGLNKLVSHIVKNKAYGLFISYSTLLIAVIYYSSLLFYLVESNHNENIHNYWSSLWWALMNVTTVGCNITETTILGQILSVVLSAMGMLMFPIFVVYLTNLIEKDIEGVSKKN